MSNSHIFEVELSPLQIRLSVEVYALLEPYFGIAITKDELEEGKKGVHIIAHDDKLKLTRFEITSTSQKTKEKIIHYLEDRDVKDFDEELRHFWVEMIHLLESQFQSDQLDTKSAWSGIATFMRELAYTLLIDTYSTHIINLLRSMIELTLRSKFDRPEAQKLSFSVVNKILESQSIEKYRALTEIGIKGFWLASRHLESVTQESESLKLIFKQNEKIEQKTLQNGVDPLPKKIIGWIQQNIADELRPRLEKIYSDLTIINKWKEIDAQIQVRAAYIFAKSIKTLQHYGEIPENIIRDPRMEFIETILDRSQNLGGS